MNPLIIEGGLNKNPWVFKCARILVGGEVGNYLPLIEDSLNTKIDHMTSITSILFVAQDCNLAVPNTVTQWSRNYQNSVHCIELPRILYLLLQRNCEYLIQDKCVLPCNMCKIYYALIIKTCTFTVLVWCLVQYSWITNKCMSIQKVKR